MKAHLFICAASLILGSALAEDVKNTTKGIIDTTDFKRPEGAVTLLGETENHFVQAKPDVCLWVFKDGVLTASPKWDSVVTKTPYQDFQLHVEFNVNEVANPKNPEQNGNSGIYIQERYEVQILNSFGISEKDYKPSYAGSIYKIKKPDQLVSKKAGEWQTYDIVFRGARFNGETKTEAARITVYHNGVLIHDDFAIPNKTGAGQKEGPEPGLIKLQGHDNPVRYRNIWIKPLNL
jgi:Domain of Unknown Function (DUF1080)